MLDVVYVVKKGWVDMLVVECFNIFLKIVDCIEENLELFVVVEIWDNGKVVWEMFNVDILLCVDYFCYYVGCIWS